MRPFLLLSTRAEQLAADEEYAAFRRETGLDTHELLRIRMTEAPLPALDPADYAGVMLGGGPFNSSDPA
ncbi:MAG TPA: glutamine amidotransferase, partial [Nocardioidaceae bacterium]|nr:glutamine amidotransferase [Nocardioidaceae bacterium]